MLLLTKTEVKAIKATMKKFIFVIVLFLALPVYARIYIPIDQPSDKPFPIAVPNLKGKKSVAKQIAGIIRHDLFLSGYFLVLDPSIYRYHARKEGVLPDEINYKYWSGIEIQALVKGEITKKKNEFTIELRLYDPIISKMLIGKRYTGTKNDLREIAHRFSDEIMKELTGLKGVFTTKIAYSAITKRGNKDIYVMDMDGHNPKKLTNNHTVDISPNWSPDGEKIVFTSYMRDNPDLYVVNSDGSGLKQIIGNSGASITPAWSPNGKFIALSSSIKGDSDIYLTTPEGKKLWPIVKGGRIDIAPTWSPNSNEIIFSSERAGGLHLYKVSAKGGKVKRLTYVGYQNDMPAWSPLGDKIVFSGRDMGAFDIFIMNPDGSNIQRLTIASGNNEHPSWSPDGRWITFSSTRTGGRAIYIMRADGSHQIRISERYGALPEWGPK